MKSNTAKLSYRTTMLARLMLPMLFVFILQAGVMIFMFVDAGIFTNSKSQAYNVLNETVRNRKFFLENEMISKWTNISILDGQIKTKIEAEAKKRNMRPENFLKNSDLVEGLLGDLIPSFTYTLRRNNVTGVFFVVNAPKKKNQANNTFYSGLYIRDENPMSFFNEYEDLLVMKGSTNISEKYNIPLASEWAPFFSIDATGKNKTDKYFTAPVKAAKQYKSLKPELLCYWGSSDNSLSLKDKVMSYSIPVISDDGVVYGVLGIDISLEYLKNYFNNEGLLGSKLGVYCVGFLDEIDDNIARLKGKKERIFSPLFVNTSNSNLTLLDSLRLKDAHTDIPNIYNIEDRRAFGARQSVSCLSFDVYPKNSIYEKEQWALIGAVPEKKLLSSYFLLRKIFIQALVIASILFLVGAFLSSKHISNTLKRVILQLEKNDSLRPIHIEKMNIKEIDALIYAIENMSVRIFNSASRVSKIVEQVQIPIGVFEHNTIHGTVFCNSIWFRLFNINKYEEDVNLPDTEFYKMIEDLEYYIHSQKDGKLIYAIPTGEPGKVRWISFSRIRDNEKIFGIATDITKETEERTRFEIQMNYDELTGLYNRAAFDRKLSEIFKNKNPGISALIMWDIDNLKFVNDSYGYSYGDAYLQTFAKKLLTLQQDRCLVARRSGDEFYTLFYGYSTMDEIKLLLHSFWKDLEKTEIKFPDGQDTRLRVSAGLAWYPNDADNLEDLIRFADFAMYNVKHSYKGNMEEFDLDIYNKNSVLVQGTEAFNRMIEKNLINYALQPIIHAGSGKVYGYEMLMRPTLNEFRNPEDVLRVARTQSKLHKIEEISFFAAMESFTEKIAKGEVPPNTKVFLNTISSQILPDIKFAEFEEKFRPYLSNIVLEITESEPLNTAVYSIKNQWIQKWNAMVAIDDFGSGYSNDSSLVFLSPNLVKIDMSIVRNVHESLDKQNILENLVSYAKKRDIIVLAEGVECVEEIDVLLRFGVDLFQGYFFAKPSTKIERVPIDRLKVLQEMYSIH